MPPRCSPNEIPNRPVKAADPQDLRLAAEALLAAGDLLQQVAMAVGAGELRAGQPELERALRSAVAASAETAELLRGMLRGCSDLN